MLWFDYDGSGFGTLPTAEVAKAAHVVIVFIFIRHSD
jgi:hypothetical protein